MTTPSRTETVLASASRDLDGKEVQPKAAGKYFHGWDEKCGPSFRRNVETVSGSREGEKIHFCCLGPGLGIKNDQKH